MHTIVHVHPPSVNDVAIIKKCSILCAKLSCKSRLLRTGRTSSARKEHVLAISLTVPNKYETKMARARFLSQLLPKKNTYHWETVTFACFRCLRLSTVLLTREKNVLIKREFHKRETFSLHSQFVYNVYSVFKLAKLELRFFSLCAINLISSFRA